MRIGPKLTIGFLSVACIAIIVGVFSIVQMGRLNDSDKYMYERMTVPLGNLVGIAMNTQRVRINLRDALEAGSGEKF